MRKLSNIQVLRGFAALAVVLFHAREDLDRVGIATGMPGFLAGAFGVDVFFVISGFVMVYASVPLFGSARSALPFMAKRLARIVPLYWLVTAVFALCSVPELRHAMGDTRLVTFVATSLAFVPYLAPMDEDATPLYPLGWTLDFEMFFYLCFALALALPRRAAVAILAGALTVLVALGHRGLLPTPGGWSYLASSQLLEFVTGMLLAQMALAGWRLSRLPAAALALAGVAAAFAAIPSMDQWWGSWRGLVWGVPASAVVGAFALCRPSGAASPVRRGLERLGDASYALYIVHYGVYLAASASLGGLVDLTGVPGPLYAATLVVLAIVVAFAVHRGFEAPVTRFLQRRAAPRQPPSLAVAEH